MTGTHWLVENQHNVRWPIYTRGNIGEVMPDVITPLGLISSSATPIEDSSTL